MTTHGTRKEKGVLTNRMVNSTLTTKYIIADRIRCESTLIRKVLEAAILELSNAANLIVKCAKRGGQVMTIGSGNSGIYSAEIMAMQLTKNYLTLCLYRFAHCTPAVIWSSSYRNYENLSCNSKEGERDINSMRISKNDIVICVCANGDSNYTLEAARAARKNKAFTIGIICEACTNLEKEVDFSIILDTEIKISNGVYYDKASIIQKKALDAVMDAVVGELERNANACISSSRGIPYSC